jgi:rhodanese-related sulfurtransferase
MSTIKEISLENFDYLYENERDSFQLIDVRNPDEYEQDNLKGILIPLPELAHRLNEIDPNKDIIVHCQHGIRSGKAVQLLQTAGFKNVQSLQGGLSAYLEFKT